jgi:hypothetical protein
MGGEGASADAKRAEDARQQQPGSQGRIRP